MHFPGFNHDSNSAAPQFPNAGQGGFSQTGFQPGIPGQPSSPPSYHSRPPPSGFRLPLSTSEPFPATSAMGKPAVYDIDGVSPVYIGSALMARSVHPCKIAPHLGAGSLAVRVPYGGSETEHNGRFDLLPFDERSMELVRTEGGRIPPGRRPVEGGYEEGGGKLYHALATMHEHGGVKVPGKCGEHLGGANVPFGGNEVFVRDYEILCWRD